MFRSEGPFKITAMLVGGLAISSVPNAIALKDSQKAMPIDPGMRKNFAIYSMIRVGKRGSQHILTVTNVSALGPT